MEREGSMALLEWLFVFELSFLLDTTLTCLHLICFTLIIKKAVVRRHIKRFFYKAENCSSRLSYTSVCLCGMRGQSVQYKAGNSAFT